MVDPSRGGGLAPEHVTYSPESQPVEGWEEKHGAGKEQGRVIKALLGGSSSVLMRETEAQGRCRIKEVERKGRGRTCELSEPCRGSRSRSQSVESWPPRTPALQSTA